MLPPQDPETAHWFATEVQPFEPELRNFLRKVTPRDNIDDVVQETYFRLLRTRLAKQVRMPRALLFTIARNAAHDIFRRQKASKTTALAEMEALGVLDTSPGPPEIVCLNQDSALLDAAIESLPERCRTVLILRKLHELSHREIAHQMGISVHTVESHLTNALRSCQKYFARHGADLGSPRHPSS